MRKVYLAACLVGSIFLACNKDPNPSQSRADIMACNEKNGWDSNKAVEAVIGEWDWIYFSCFYNGGIDQHEAYKGLSILFKSDMTLVVKQDGQVTQTSTWNVVSSETEYLVIEADPYVTQLSGRILFCDDLVEFNQSYIDGCDNYLERVQ